MTTVLANTLGHTKEARLATLREGIQLVLIARKWREEGGVIVFRNKDGDERTLEAP